MREVSILTIPIDVPYGTWRLWLCVGVIACMIIFLKPYLKVIGEEAVALWGWVLFLALWTIEFPMLAYGDAQRAFEATAGATALEALLVPLAILTAAPQLWRLQKWVMLAAIALVWSGHSLMTDWTHSSPSFDTALLALYFPFAPWWMKPLILVTVFSFHGTGALLILLFELLAFILLKTWTWPRKERIALWGGICGFLLLGAAGLYLFRDTSAVKRLLEGQTNRLAMWQRYMDFWLHGPGGTKIIWPFVLIGVGAGSFLWCAIMVDMPKFALPQEQFMHNEFLQVTFELGLVGILLALALLYRALKNAWGDPRLFPALCGFVAFALTWHPLRHFPTMLLVGLIFWRALVEKKSQGPGIFSRALSFTRKLFVNRRGSPEAHPG